MYTYCVIDDEEMIRLGIPALIDWEREGFASAGTAKDGVEGLKLILEQQPDLVLVDIRMPGLNGLEVIRKAKKSGFNGFFIILTAYSQFEYAKTAIKQGVDAYLLKPIDEEELLHTAREIREKLETRETLKKSVSELERLRLSEGLKASFLKNPLPEPSMEAELERFFEEQGNAAFVVLVKDTMTQPGDSRDAFIDRVEEKNMLADEKTLRFMLDAVYVIVVFSDEEERVRAALQLFLGTSPWEEGFPVAMGFSVNLWQNLCYSYEMAQYLLDRSFLFEPDELIHYGYLEKANENWEGPDFSKIPEVLRFGEKEDFLQFVSSCAQGARRALVTEAEIKGYVRQLSNYLLEDPDLDHEYILNNRHRVFESPTLETCCRNMYGCLENLKKSLQFSDRGKYKYSMPVEKCLFYIRNYYKEDISLDSCATRYHYNVNYLGRLFRKEVGHSFARELEYWRLDRAAELLESSDIKVYEAAERVGFSNMDAFYGKFRKRFKQTPKSYQSKAKKRLKKAENA